jgi:hypothetical protein
MKKKISRKKNLVAQEVARKISREKTVYHYIDTKRKINILSKLVFKRHDKFILYPFYVNRETGKAKSKYRKIRTFTLEGFKERVPSGFITTASRGYGVTRDLKPLIRFIEKNLAVKDITITTRKKSKYSKGKIILNYKDFEELRNHLVSKRRIFNEENKVLVNNHFAELVPAKFQAGREKYQGGTICGVIRKYEAVEKNLSAEDKTILFSLFEKLSLERKDILEKQKLISTKENIEKKFIEDVLKQFEKLLSKKRLKEEKWQEFFKENAWIFSQLFAYPAVLIVDKAYVGGKDIENVEGKIVDFLYANNLTRNSALIEIKMHSSKLLSKKPYRGSDVFNMDKELSGAISQVLDQKETYCKKFDSIRERDDIVSFNPKCVVIIGKISSLSNKQFKAFELIRSSLKDIDIITFDELYERIKSILSIFKTREIKKSSKSKGKMR